MGYGVVGLYRWDCKHCGHDNVEEAGNNICERCGANRLKKDK